LFLDVVVLFLLLFFGFSGYRNGAFLQVFSSLLTIVSFILARMASHVFEGMIASWLEVDPRYAGFVGFLITWCVLYMLLRLFTMGIARTWKGMRSDSGGLDRYIGACLGLVKGMIGIYFALSIMVLANKAIAKSAPQFWIHYQDSYVGGFVERNNLFEHLPDRRLHAMSTLVRLANDPSGMKRLSSDPVAFQAYQRLNTKVLSDHPRLRQGLLKGDFAAVATDDGVIKLLDDPDFVQLLDAADATRSTLE
jgi:uncharacterized membrane protein required for colicin V production